MTEPRTFKASSPAKLNLTFSVLGDLPDGFHEVETLMQAIDLEDELKFSIEPSDKTEVILTTSGGMGQAEFPCDDTNLIAKAVRLFIDTHKSDPISVSVDIRKNIPVAAGMGGGSSNAASTLLVLNRFFNNALSKTQLEEMASQLGADVPFFIHGGVQIGRHRGDKLTAVPSSEKMHFVVVKPREIGIATPWIYAEFDKYKAENSLIEVSLKTARSAREDGNVPLAARSFLNVFEPIVMQHYPDLIEVRDTLMGLGALGCCMTGSGPTIFAVCDSPRLSGFIAKELKRSEQNKGNQKLTLDFWPVATIDRGPTVAESSPHAVRQRK